MMKEIIREFMLDCETGNLSQATLTLYKRTLRDFATSLEKESLNEIDPSDIRAWIKRLRERPGRSKDSQGLSPTSIKTYVAVIKSFFAWAIREGLIENQKNPMRAIRTPKVPRKVIPSLDRDTLNRLLKSWDSPRASSRRNQVMIVTLLDTGLRASELLGLQLDDFDPARGSLTVNGKGNRQRLVPISETVSKMLNAYIENVRPHLAKDQANGYVFLSQKGRSLKAAELSRIVRRAKAEAGINGATICTPHTLRHTFALSWCRNGGNVLYLQKILGHSSLDMTRRYVDECFTDLSNEHRNRSPAEAMLEGRRL